MVEVAGIEHVPPGGLQYNDMINNISHIVKLINIQ